MMKKTLTAGFILCLICTNTLAQIPKGKIVYSSGKRGDRAFQLFVINSDGTENRQLTHSETSCVYPDVFQSTIVCRQRYRSSLVYSIALTHFGDEDALKQLIGDKKGYYDGPRWRPDGTLIAYEDYNSNLPEIWVIDSSGRNKRSLIKNARHPSWTFDSKKILFTRDHEVYIFDLKTQIETQLTHVMSKGIYARYPSISPDEQKLAFDGLFDEYGKRKLFIVNLNGSDTPLTVDDCSSAYWTSDPRYLVCDYHDKINNSWRVVMLDVTTGKKTPVTSGNCDNEPCWVRTK